MGVRELTVTYDGHHLNDLFVVEDVVREATGEFVPETATVAGRNGRMWRGTRRDSISITLVLVAVGNNYDEVLAKIRTLASWLDVEEPARLAIGDEGGLWRMAAPTGQTQLERIGVHAARVSVAMTCVDACMHGPGGSVTSSSGTATLYIDGTLPTPVRIYATSAKNNYTVTDQTIGKHVTVAVGSTAKALVIDSASRSATVAGVLKLPTLDSDWLVLAPGAHTLARTSGTGEFTATYESRWA